MLTRIITLVLELLFAACGVSSKPAAATHITTFVLELLFAACGASSKPAAAPPTTAMSAMSAMVSPSPALNNSCVALRLDVHCPDGRNGLSGYRVYVVESGPARGKRVVEHYGDGDGDPYGAGETDEQLHGHVVLAPVTVSNAGWPNSCAGMTLDGAASGIVVSNGRCL